MNVGKAIVHYRGEIGLSCSDLARLSYVPKSVISKIEAGHNNVEIITLVKLSLPLGVRASDILKLAEELL